MHACSQIHSLAHPLCLGEGAAEGTDLNVGEGNRGVGAVLLDILGVTGSGGASATSDTGLGGGGIGWVRGVEPEHLGEVVVPDGHDEDHTLLKVLALLGHAAAGGEGVGVAENGLLGLAGGVGEGVGLGGHAGDVDDRVLDDLAVLDVDALDLLEGAGVGAVGGDELGDDGHLLLSVDDLAGAEERGVAHAVGVEVAAVTVALAVVALVVGTAVSVTGAADLTDGLARVRGEGGGDAVGLPDVHLTTAGSVATGARVGVAGGANPALDVGL